MRRSLDIPARWVASGGWVLVLVAGACVAGWIAATGLSEVVPNLFYDVAFGALVAGGAHALQRRPNLDRIAWNLGAGGRLVVFLAATLLELALLLLLAAILARISGRDLPASSLFGLLHLTAVALVLARLSLRPVTAVYSFLTLIWVVPALIPALQPMLDVRRSFHPGGFPGWIGAVSPILALGLGAFALPARTASPTGTTSA